MHSLYKVCEDEIDSLLKKPLTASSVGIIGDLVDICKDIKNIEYWDMKMGAMGSNPGWGSSHGAEDRKSVWGNMDTKISEFEKVSERMHNTDSPEDRKKFEHDAKEMIESASKIKAIMASMPLDEEVAARYRDLFRG